MGVRWEREREQKIEWVEGEKRKLGQWHKWQELQLKFLHKSTRQQLHKTILGIEEKEVNQEISIPENLPQQSTPETQN